MSSDHHVQAVIVCATAVFVRDLMRCMDRLHKLEEDLNTKQLLQYCTCYLLQHKRTQQLEQIVMAVIQHEYNMPDDIENAPMLTEMLPFYKGAFEAEQNGTQQQYRNNVLFPAITESDIDTIPDGIPKNSEQFQQDVLAAAQNASEQKSSSKFALLVQSAIDDLNVQRTGTEKT